MTAELDIGGLLVPTLLLSMLAAWLLMLPLRRLLGRLGTYRLVWHPPLFDLALFVMLTAGLAALW